MTDNRAATPEELEIARATPASETDRIAALSAEHGIDLPDDVDLADVPELVRPAARLFATVAGELRQYGIDVVPMLADARYDALTRELENLLGLDRGRVELNALRGTEAAIVPLLVQVRAQVAEAQAQQRRAQLTALTSPEEVAAVEKILNGAPAAAQVKRGR